MLPRDEWLSQAQRLPVGQSRRIRHGAEASSAMVVRNEYDKWSAYCHRCGEGGVVFKEHQRLSDAEQFQTPRQNWPADAVPLQDASRWLRNRAYDLLVQKGIDPGTMLVGVPCMLSQSTQRLILGTRWGWIGRALTPNVHPKWIEYRGRGGFPSWGQHIRDATLHSHVILVEDFLSALKLHWALQGTNYSALAILGTKIHQRLVMTLLDHSVLFMLDGDRAGRDGARKGMRQLRALGIPCAEVQLPEGKDPKDMHKAFILNAINEVNYV